jgi:uncharacterized protein (TIGR01619 family)
MGIFDFLKRSNGNDDSVEKLMEHQENWAAYLTTIDGDAPGSILVDLGLREVAPRSDLPDLLVIDVPIKHERENGLPEVEEFDILAEIEEGFDSALGAINRVFAGHLYCEGVASTYFYIASGVNLEPLLWESMEAFPSYTFTHRINHDPDWESYFNFLFPAPIELQRLGNESVIRNLSEHGDNLEKERKVEHWIYFPSETDRSRFLDSIADQGFSVEDLSKDEDYELPYRAQISREDKVTLEATDEYILDLWQKAQDFNGNYDGWETFIVKD